jgi:hypothetical protein
MIRRSAPAKAGRVVAPGGGGRRVGRGASEPPVWTGRRLRALLCGLAPVDVWLAWSGPSRPGHRAPAGHVTPAAAARGVDVRGGAETGVTVASTSRVRDVSRAGQTPAVGCHCQPAEHRRGRRRPRAHLLQADRAECRSDDEAVLRSGIWPGSRQSGPRPLGLRLRRPRGLRRSVPCLRPRADRRLRSIRGIGPWTSAEVRQRACGDADAVSVGDYHLPAQVGWVLAGKPADDDGMLELLAPYRGQRHRAARLIELSGLGPPRRGPRLPVRDYRSL